MKKNKRRCEVDVSARGLRRFFQEQGACEEAIAWAKGKTLQEAWAKCRRGDWMMWLMDCLFGRHVVRVIHRALDGVDPDGELPPACTAIRRLAPGNWIADRLRTVLACGKKDWTGYEP